jgi:hypothetical protein
MVSRRRLLQSGGAALLAAVAGCTANDPDDPTTEGPTDGPTTDEPTDTTAPDEPTLSATVVDASDVAAGSTVAVATPELHALVADAAAADGRVDLQDSWDGDTTEPLALGQFDYLRFDGETYHPNAAGTRFAQEASYSYSAEEIQESEVDGDVVEYADLNESERAVVDEMFANGSFDVGFHEERPDAVDALEPNDYLRVENKTYQITVVVGDSAPHYTLDLDAADPGENAQVVTVADRVPAASFGETFVTATEDGSVAVSTPDELGAYLDSVDYVVGVNAVAKVVLRRTED